MVVSKLKKMDLTTKRGTTLFQNPAIINEFTEHDNEPPNEQRLKLLVGEALNTLPEHRSNEQLETLGSFFKRYKFFTDLKENHNK